MQQMNFNTELTEIAEEENELFTGVVAEPLRLRRNVLKLGSVLRGLCDLCG